MTDALGPAIAGGPTRALWVYVAAPGAAVAVGLYAYLAAERGQPAAGTG